MSVRARSASGSTRRSAGACRASASAYFVLREADYLGLSGYVANERDGSVRVVAEGPVEVLDELLARLHEGPPASIVERVIERREPARGIGGGFRIESGEHRGD